MEVPTENGALFETADQNFLKLELHNGIQPPTFRLALLIHAPSSGHRRFYQV